MKRIILLLTAALAAACCDQGNLHQWNMQRSTGGKTYKVNVPCTVAGALLDCGESVEASMFDTTWVFTSKFPGHRRMAHILSFGSLNFSADIIVNGTTIASADTTIGTFVKREYDISPLIKRRNTLKIVVHKAPAQSLNHGFVDWNPRPEDESMGITGPVELIVTPDIQIKDVFVVPEVDPSDLTKAAINVSATLVNRNASSVEGIFKACYEDGSWECPVTIEGGQSLEISHHEEISNPRIWWPREMGSPELYHLKASFINSEGHESHSQRVRFGIRSITGEIDSYGHRLYKVNGREVLLKAGGWTDDRYMRDTHESISTQLAYVADMGLNCIRFENIWGKDDFVYDLSDSLGIMNLVGWSCQWEWDSYCGYPSEIPYGCITTPETKALAARYFHDQVIRLRNHPAVIGWLTGSDMIPDPELEKQYLQLYSELDYRPYQCSASGLVSELSGPSGAKMLGPYEYVGPDYWYRDTQGGGNYGFNTETSSGMNIPQIESLKRMLPESELWPVGESWNKICTSAAEYFNSPEPALEAASGHFGGAPSTLEEFVKRSHTLDYNSTRAMFEAFRCAVPRTTGIVQWMLNSAFPSAYWQLYDWYMVPTAGYYGVKKACAPVQLIYNYMEKAVYAVDDAMPEGCYTAIMRIFDASSALTGTSRKEIVIKPREPQKVFDKVTGPAFIDLALLDGNGNEVARNFYCISGADTDYAWDEADWWGIPINSYASYAFVNSLPAVNLEMECSRISTGWKVNLYNPSETIAYQNILKALDKDGNLVGGVVWTDNFVSVLPGETVTLECTDPREETVSIVFDGWNVSEHE